MWLMEFVRELLAPPLPPVIPESAVPDVLYPQADRESDSTLVTRAATQAAPKPRRP